VGIAVFILAAVILSILLYVRTDWDVRIILAITFIPAVVLALLVFVPGVRSTAAASLGAIFGLRGIALAIAILTSTVLALLGLILWREGVGAVQRTGIVVLIVALLYLMPNLLTGIFALINALLAAIAGVAGAILAWFNGIPGAIATVAAAIIALIGVLLAQVVTVIIQIATIRRAGRDQRHEQASANERTQDEIIQAYIDWITEELLTRDGHPESPGSRAAARAKTLWILSRLGKEHKRTVIQFLRNTGLVPDRGSYQYGEEYDRVHRYSEDVVIVLDGADLSDANLESVDLSDISLRGTNLGGADLQGANLRGADLAHTNLGSGKAETTLSFAGRLRRFVTVSSRQILRRRIPIITTGARGANLRGAYLADANLAYADLRGADLVDSKLTSTYLEGADLGGAYLADSELEGAYLRRAVMPDGTVHS